MVRSLSCPTSITRVVFEQQVIGRQHGGVGGRHGHLDAGLSHRGNGLDVVPVSMGLDHLADIEPAAQLKKAFVLVGGVDQHRLA